jgi:hypothetical protein
MFLNGLRAKLNLEAGYTLKTATIVGIVLIFIGIIGLAVDGFSFTHEGKDIDPDPLEVEHKKTESVPTPRLLSAIALVGGIVLVVIGGRGK